MLQQYRLILNSLKLDLYKTKKGAKITKNLAPPSMRINRSWCTLPNYCRKPFDIPDQLMLNLPIKTPLKFGLI